MPSLCSKEAVPWCRSAVSRTVAVPSPVHADGGFAGGIGGAAGDGLADQLTGDVVALVLHVGLVGAGH